MFRINNHWNLSTGIMFTKSCSEYHAYFNLNLVFLARNFRNGYCIAYLSTGYV